MITDTALADYITRQQITLRVAADLGYATDPDGWDHHAYKLRLHNGATGRSMTVPWRQGLTHTTPPTAVDVLDVLIADATGYRYADGFEDWCREYAYDSDSPAAQRTYKAIARDTARLERFLGDTLLEA